MEEIVTKFYLYRPHGHGRYSFGVIANNEDEAKIFIQHHIDSRYLRAKYDETGERKVMIGHGEMTYPARKSYRDYDYCAAGWPDDYDLAIFDFGQIMEHSND